MLGFAAKFIKKSVNHPKMADIINAPNDAPTENNRLQSFPCTKLRGGYDEELMLT